MVMMMAMTASVNASSRPRLTDEASHLQGSRSRQSDPRTPPVLTPSGRLTTRARAESPTQQRLRLFVARSYVVYEPCAEVQRGGHGYTRRSEPEISGT